MVRGELDTGVDVIRGDLIQPKVVKAPSAVAQIAQVTPQAPKPVEAIQPTSDVGLFNKLKDIVSDVGNTIAYSVAAPVNSVTGHQFKPEYKTKVGAVLGQGSNVGVDSLHILGKSFADTITGGGATKLANTIRKEGNKESAFNYTEMKNVKSVNTGVSFIDKGFQTYQKVSKGGAAVLGTLAGASALKGGADKLLGNNPPQDVAAAPAQTQQVSTVGGLGIAALAFAGALLLK